MLTSRQRLLYLIYSSTLGNTQQLKIVEKVSSTILNLHRLAFFSSLTKRYIWKYRYDLQSILTALGITSNPELATEMCVCVRVHASILPLFIKDLSICGYADLSSFQRRKSALPLPLTSHISPIPETLLRQCLPFIIFCILYSMFIGHQSFFSNLLLSSSKSLPCNCAKLACRCPTSCDLLLSDSVSRFPLTYQHPGLVLKPSNLITCVKILRHIQGF